MKTIIKTVATLSLALAISWTVAPEPVYSQQAGVIGTPVNVPGIDKPVRVIRGRFTSDVTLTNDTYWVLRGAVFIGEPARLIIPAGTRLIGETATRGTLVIERGAQIFANGTAAAPVVMTSDQPVGRRFRGDWGGLVINGRAPLNLPGGTAIGEGSTGVYGGTNPADNSASCATFAWSSPAWSSVPTTNSTASPSRRWAAAPSSSTSRSTTTRMTASRCSAGRSTSSGWC
jgi:hypothetical protein